VFHALVSLGDLPHLLCRSYFGVKDQRLYEFLLHD
jgi:hypothetical protein